MTQEGEGVQYRLLGKLEVERNGELVDIGSFRQRAVLAFLLTTPNTIASTDQIMERPKPCSRRRR